ncbi:ATP-binding cassette domain-containing protein [Streptomyces sp. 71268]|uniref:ABC transporter ATP-binding protein n=1 Tax=Streptomyces sp. 71268 TaxID=3002640 RepID=UPI0023F7FF4B|nr:ATP-binding cassette domain-containing protein [Streptomyces sp. 71268]WEV24836.1 ATP-binding cassette domain-containing protein [Streptomyces sp. 71268]
MRALRPPPGEPRTPLALEGVGRRYGPRGPWVLRDVELAVPAGTLLRIVGTNGTGKSTLLRIVAGIDQPTVGRVRGRPRTAYVPERFPAELPFTAVGYLTHLGRVHGLRGRRAADAAARWLERFGAAGHARTPLAELSKGTSQKVAVAQALLADPELLVFDEAWTGLDQRARGELDRAVAERVADGGAVVFVDHDPRRLAGVADAVYRVHGTGLAPWGPDGPLTADGAAGPGAAGRRVRIEAVGPPGAAPPDGLPGAPEVAGAPDGGTALTVSAAYSDALLRALLMARPPWHIRAVTAPPTPDEPPASGGSAGRASHSPKPEGRP